MTEQVLRGPLSESLTQPLNELMFCQSQRLLAYCLISECECRGVLQRAECVETIGEWSSARVNKCQLFPSCGGFLLLTANTSKTVRPAPSRTTTGTDWGTQRPGFSYPFTETTVDQMSGGTVKVKSAN